MSNLGYLRRKEKIRIPAYADTGCTTGIYVFREQVKDIPLGKKISDEPTPCIVADGHRIGADEYLTTVYINGETQEITITVVDPTEKMGRVSIEEMTPLLGREFLDRYDVLFRGKTKRVALFHPE